MIKKINNLQDTFLNQLRKDNITATIILVNGYQFKGSIRCFDNFTILLQVEEQQQMVYKHASPPLFLPVMSRSTLHHLHQI